MLESKLICNASGGERNTILKIFLMGLISIESHAHFSQVTMIEGIGGIIFTNAFVLWPDILYNHPNCT